MLCGGEKTAKSHFLRGGVGFGQKNGGKSRVLEKLKTFLAGAKILAARSRSRYLAS